MTPKTTPAEPSVPTPDAVAAAPSAARPTFVAADAAELGTILDQLRR